jgi:dihydrofolate reductase
VRDVVLQQYAVSLDGFSCADGSEFQKYVFGVDDPEVDEVFIELLSRAGTHIMGRATYLDMAMHWPSRSGSTADLMNSIPKVVFSRTLEHADWPESRIAGGETAAEIAKLKEEPGGEIVAHGGFRFTQSLVKLGLVDELRLYIFPVALGNGISIFDTLDDLTEYESTSFRRFPSGVVLHTLRPVRSHSTAARILQGELGQTEFLSQDPPKNT